MVDQPKPRHVPVRTCVGCRQKAAAGELLRVVARSGSSGQDAWSVAPDPRRCAPGRGAHLHPAEACLARAEKSRAFVRALRHDAAAYGPLDLAPLREHVEQHLRQTTPRPDDTGSTSS